MTHSGKRAALLAAAGIFAAASATGCSGSIDTDAVVATVGGEDITLGVANFYARMMQGQYETYYASMMGMTGETMWSQEVSDGMTYEDSVKDGAMESLQDLYLISQHASEYEVELTADEKEAIKDAARAFDEANTDEAKEAVSGYRKDVEKYLELITIQYKMDDKMREGVDEEVSDEEAAQKAMKYVYFSYTDTDDEGNTVDLTDDEKAALKEDAQALADRAAAGEDFASVAEEMGKTANDMTFDSETAALDEELIKAADALEAEGGIAGPVETDNGIYVAQLTSLLDRDATDQKKADIVDERRQEQYDSLLDGWRGDTEIEVDEKVWDKVDFEGVGVTIITQEEEDTGDAQEADAEDTQE